MSPFVEQSTTHVFSALRLKNVDFAVHSDSLYEEGSKTQLLSDKAHVGCQHGTQKT